MVRFAIVLSMLLAVALCGITISQADYEAPRIPDTGIMAGHDTWGDPPQNNVPVVVPKLPDVKGWYWLLGAEYPEFLTTGNGVVVVGSVSMTALDAQSGQVLWSNHNVKNLDGADPAIVGDRIIYDDGNDVVATGLRTGSELWRVKQAQLRTVSPQICWLVSNGRTGDVWEWKHGEFLQVDTANGHELSRVRFENLLGAAMGAVPLAAPLVVKSGGEFIATLPNGQQVKTTAVNASLGSWISLTTDGYLAAEFADIFDRKAPTTLSFIELPSGKIRWQQQVDAQGFSRYLERPWVNPDFVVFNERDDKLHALRLADGKQVYVSGTRALFNDPQQVALDGNQLMFQADVTNTRSVLTLVNLSTGQAQPVTDLPLEPSACRLAGTQLYFLNDNNTLTAGGGFHPDPVNAVWSVTLADGKVVPGVLTQLNSPHTPEALRQRFLTSPSPLADADLMRELVAGGTTQLLDLLNSSADLKGPQSDAVLAAAFHSSHGLAEQAGPFAGCITAVLAALESKLTSDYAPQLIRWLEDPSLASLKPQLVGMLAQCGGPDAGRWLNAFYGDFASVQQFDPPEPPFNGCDSNEYTVYARQRPRTKSTLQSQTYVDEVAIKVHRTTYTLFTSDMLGSSRDIYLGIGPDHGYDEVLPTGLSDVFFESRWGSPNGQEVHRRGPIAIRVQGDNVYIRHHIPVYTTKTYEGGSYKAFTDTRYVTTRLSLKALRRDSDGDGLTDILEARLGTDPHKADTDGDGIPDKHDRLPNVDPRKWGPQERGVARALRFHQLERGEVHDEDKCFRLPPFKVRYFSAASNMPVAIATGSSYCVHVDQKDGSSWTLPGTISASWEDNVDGWRNVGSSPLYGQEAKGLVSIGDGNISLMVVLVQIDGEYYPEKVTTLAIAD